MDFFAGPNSENGFPRRGDPQTERSPQTGRDSENGFPKWETPQTERTVQKSEDSENGFPEIGDTTDKKSLY